MEVILSSKKSYQWTTVGNVSFRGYFQYDNSLKVYRNNEAVMELTGIKDQSHFDQFLKSIDGCFSIIINNPSCTMLAVDRARSLPLFYSKNYVSDSAEEIRKAENIAKEAVNEDFLIELATNHYLFGNRTVYGEIGQLDLGEMICISGANIIKSRYYVHINKIEQRTLEQIKKELLDTATKSFLKIKEAIDGRPVVLSLSGGYDSRFVACMLKKVGVNDVSCYTYGINGGNHETIQSKEVAEALGYRWTCVEYTDELMRSQLDEVGMAYIDSYEVHDFTAYMQNLPAVRKLHEEGWFKPGSVFITGLCGDMPTGAYIQEEDPSCHYDSDYVASTIFNLTFNSFEISDGLKSRWMAWMKDYINEIPYRVNDYQSYQSVVDCIYTGTCHAHAFLHMNSVHSFFGYEYLLPYWDKDLLKVWYSIPSKLKKHQALYEDFLLNDICAQYGINKKKTTVTYYNEGWKRKLLFYIGGIYSRLMLNTGNQIRRPTDYNNFGGIEIELYKMLKSKSNIFYKKAGLIHMIGYFTLERRYGIESCRKFKKNVRVKI